MLASWVHDVLARGCVTECVTELVCVPGALGRAVAAFSFLFRVTTFRCITSEEDSFVRARLGGKGERKRSEDIPQSHFPLQAELPLLRGSST